MKVLVRFHWGPLNCENCLRFCWSLTKFALLLQKWLILTESSLLHSSGFLVGKHMFSSVYSSVTVSHKNHCITLHSFDRRFCHSVMSRPAHGWWFYSHIAIMTNPRSTFLSHLSSSSFGLCLGPCGSPSFAGGSLQVPACLQHSGCLWAADTGLGKTAARRTVSGPETLYSLGEACCLDHRVRTCICRRKTAFFQKTEYEKLLFILLAHFNPWLSGWSTTCVRYTAYIYSTGRLTLHRLSNES